MGRVDEVQARFTQTHHVQRLAQQWAPGSGGRARTLDGIAERFQEFCDKPDPRPESAAAVKRELRLAEARAERPSGAELAKRAIEAGKAEENARRSASGRGRQARTPPVPFKVLNAPPEPDKLAKDDTPPPDPVAKILDTAPKAEPPRKGRRLGACQQRPRHRPRSCSSRSPWPAPPSRWSRPPARGTEVPRLDRKLWRTRCSSSCSVIDKVVNYTVVDVNEGAKKREADAFISAYAKEGAIAGEFGSGRPWRSTRPSSSVRKASVWCE